MDHAGERTTSSVAHGSMSELSAGLAGFGLYRMSGADVPAVRRRPGPVPEGWGRVPASLLRYSDDQSVAGTASVFAAIQNMGSHPDQFHDWGVVAASRFLGRANLAAALRSFRAEGVWGTSPHLIPHFALHSASGTISLALGSHGPNLGVGGGLHSASEGFLTALTWLSTDVVPGVWLVLTGWTPELVPDPVGNNPPAGECLALALALEAAGGADRQPAFRVVVGPGRARVEAPLDLAWLAEQLKSVDERSARTIASDPHGTVQIELIGRMDAAE